MKQRRHMCTNIEGMLRNCKGKKINFMEDGEGNVLTDKQAKETKCSTCGKSKTDNKFCSNSFHLPISDEKEPVKESHIDLWNEGEEFYNKSYSGTYMSEFLKPYIINSYIAGKRSSTTIQRKSK